MRNSIDEPLSKYLIESAESARNQITLIAPFITLKAFEAIFQKITAAVHLNVVTRWNYMDLISGVSDPHIWDNISQRPNSALLLSPSLHAKYYRFDDMYSIGSANITQPGIQLGRSHNIELLQEQQRTSFSDSFEKNVLAQSTIASQDLFEEAARNFRKSRETPDIQRQQNDIKTDWSPSTWLPELRNPESLWAAYLGRTESMSSIELKHAVADLYICELPDGLTQSQFEASIKSVLSQMPMIAAINELLRSPQRFGAIRDLISTRFTDEGLQRDPGEAWQAAMRWLLHFFPDTYARSVPRHSEIMIRRQD